MLNRRLSLQFTRAVKGQQLSKSVVEAHRPFPLSWTSRRWIGGSTAAPASAVTTTVLSKEDVLEKAREGAITLGYDPLEVYEPYAFIDVLQQALLSFNSAVGDASLAIIITALGVRLLTWPWNISALKRRCDGFELMPIYMNMAKAHNDAQRRRGGAGGGGAAGAEKAEADIQELQLKLNDFTSTTRFSPMQGLGYQFGCLMPIFFTGYCTLRGMVTHPDSFRDFVTSPTLWLDSVVLADPYGALPLMSAMAVLSNIELNAQPPQPGQEATAEYFRLVMRGASLAFVPITGLLPSALFIFITTNSVYTSLLTYVYRRYWWVKPQIDPKWLVKSK